MLEIVNVADRPFTLYFVRHGITEPNFQGLRCGGDFDIPLMDIGVDQAYLLAKQIAKMDLGIGAIVAGSLIRTRQTALIISGVLGGIPVTTEAGINERHLGRWNNRPVEETEAMLKAGDMPPGGESEDQFMGRIERALDRLKPLLDKKPLLVSSKGVGRVLNTILGGEGRMQVANGEIVEFAVARAGATGSLSLSVSRPHQM